MRRRRCLLRPSSTPLPLASPCPCTLPRSLGRCFPLPEFFQPSAQLIVLIRRPAPPPPPQIYTGHLRRKFIPDIERTASGKITLSGDGAGGGAFRSNLLSRLVPVEGRAMGR